VKIKTPGGSTGAHTCRTSEIYGEADWGKARESMRTVEQELESPGTSTPPRVGAAISNAHNRPYP
jgi:hypothetical protein